MVAVGTDLFVFGGCGDASGRLADLHKFDTKTRTWTALGTSNVLRGRGGANMITLKDGALAVVAGFVGEETNDGQDSPGASGRFPGLGWRAAHV